MEKTKKAAADAGSAVDSKVKQASDATGQGFKDAGQAVDSAASNVSDKAREGAEGATGLMNKGLDATLPK